MNMREKIALYVMVLREKFSHNRDEFYSRLCEGIPWLLLPDAIIEYIGYYQPSHFVELAGGTDISWLKFPSGELLAEITASNIKEVVEYHLADSKYLSCKGTCLDEFDRKNYGHVHFHELRINILQEMIFDQILCEKLLDESKSYDDYFVVRHNQTCLNSFQLQEQMEKLEELGFLYLVRKVYEKTGLLLNQEWFEKNVHQVLLYSDYPRDLAESTHSSMQISPEIEGRINDLNFEFSEGDKSKITITDELEKTLDEMYAVAYKLAWSEI